ncbi:MAG: hypothetical protein AAF465_04870 [Pseudomonadota bacterium]
MFFARLLVLTSALAGCATLDEPLPVEVASFAARCSHPAVVRCVAFERHELGQAGVIQWGRSDARVGVFVNGYPPSANLQDRVTLDEAVAASGDTSLRFAMPSGTGAGYGGQFYANFSDDLSVQFDEGDEFFVQWRQRFSSAFLSNRYRPFDTWKQVVIGEGDRPGVNARSCTQLELVVHHKHGAPAMYHSCRGKDGQSAEIVGRRAVPYVADEWMTFQVHVKIGTWYQNDKRYAQDSVVELWAAREGQPSRRVLKTTVDLANTQPQARYGKVWLLPYLTGKDRTQQHADAYTWYDELIVSTERIADPTGE